MERLSIDEMLSWVGPLDWRWRRCGQRLLSDLMRTLRSAEFAWAHR